MSSRENSPYSGREVKDSSCLKGRGGNCVMWLENVFVRDAVETNSKGVGREQVRKDLRIHAKEFRFYSEDKKPC